MAKDDDLSIEDTRKLMDLFNGPPIRSSEGLFRFGEETPRGGFKDEKVIDLRNTCKDCKWWEKRPKDMVPEEVPFRAVLEFKICENPHFIYGPSPASEGRPVTLDSLLYEEILDNFNDTASTGEVITGPDFGCIHHAPKDK